MEYRRFEDRVIIRIDPGEEILTELREVSERENIKLAGVTGLGATDRFTVGLYDLDRKEYLSNTYTGAFEIVSLVGTVNTMDGEYYAHIHMSAGDRENRVFGGHLNEAYVSATCEIVLTVIDGSVDRQKDPATGINVYKFE